MEENKYYAFGMNHLSRSFGPSNYDPLSVPYNYKYNGKELQETGMYDYGWRMYMPDIGRWNGIDQLAEKYYSTSPYAYVVNNPISFIDPDGRRVVETADGWTFTGSDIQGALNYFSNGGDYDTFVSDLENGGGSFGSSPVSNYWANHNPGPSWFGRTWTNIKKFFGYKPKPRILIGKPGIVTEFGEVLSEEEDLVSSFYYLGSPIGDNRFQFNSLEFLYAEVSGEFNQGKYIDLGFENGFEVEFGEKTTWADFSLVLIDPKKNIPRFESNTYKKNQKADFTIGGAFFGGAKYSVTIEGVQSFTIGVLGFGYTHTWEESGSTTNFIGLDTGVSGGIGFGGSLNIKLGAKW